jgi:hypothetical protein
MELRLWVAYGLIALLMLIAAKLYRRVRARRRARRRLWHRRH